MIANLLLRAVAELAVTAVLVGAALMAWPVPAVAADALPPEADGSIAAAPVHASSTDGGCSSPFGGTRWGFAAACELHDHRYDLLRRAATIGAPLPADVRRGADAAFAEQLDERCDTRAGWDAVGCRVTARLYAGTVAANSWRQRYGPPVPEPALPWLAGTGVVVVLATSIGLSLARAAGTAPGPPITGARSGMTSRTSSSTTSTRTTGRDRYADLLRTLALAAVVLGHWTMAAITVDAQGDVSVSNALSELPSWHGVTWIFQLVPLFFFVGGVANAAAWRRIVDSGGNRRSYHRRRLGGLLRPASGLLIGAPVGAVVLLAVGVPAELVIQTLAFVLLPLWFLVVYVPLTAAAPYLLWLHARFAVRVPLLLASAVALLDIARHITGRIEFGWPNMLLLYTLAQQLGFCYRDEWLLSIRRRWLLLWSVGALGGLIATTASPIWPTTMVGLPGEPSNMTPPGVPLLCLLLLQVPVVVLLRPYVLPLLQRPAAVRMLDAISQRSMSAFLWHVPLLVVFAGMLMLLGAPFPAVGSIWWWWTRPLWLAALTLLLLGALSGRRGIGAVSSVLSHGLDRLGSVLFGRFVNDPVVKALGHPLTAEPPLSSSRDNEGTQRVPGVGAVPGPSPTLRPCTGGGSGGSARRDEWA